MEIKDRYDVRMTLDPCGAHEDCILVWAIDDAFGVRFHIQEPQKAKIIEALNGRRGTAGGVSVDLARRVPT